MLAMGFVVLTACDGYIEEVRVERSGDVEFVAQAVVVCTDPLQRAIWEADPCDSIDEAVRSGTIGDLPFDFDLDPNRVGLVGTGEADRRTIDATWTGTIDELSTVLISSGSITPLDDERTEAVFVSSGAPADELRDSTDDLVVDELRTARWDPAQFRVKAPDLIVEHNGDDIQGRIVIWELDGDHPDEFRIVWSTEDPPRRLWWWLLGTVILTVVLIMMVTLEGPKQSKPQRNPEPEPDA
jgi:hypothetical protein